MDDVRRSTADAEQPHKLSRSVTLTLAVLFGLGVTIGAGIYVLIGATAGRAGIHAPLAFVLAAIVMAPTAASFAELATRHPVSAGEAAYVGEGFRSDFAALVVGLLVIVIAVLSAAAISRGSAGYIRELSGLPLTIILPAVIVSTGAIAAWGIRESVMFAAILTVIELGGLLAIILVGAVTVPGLVDRVPEVWADLWQLPVLAGVLAGSLLAFFAFIGFEGLANIAEEVVEPERTLPRAIFITLFAATTLYVAVAWVALVAVPAEDLARSDAPLSLVMARATGASPTVITLVAIVATVNGIIVQIVMASRVIYGLSDRGQLPALLAHVNRVTHTPISATLLVMGTVLGLAMLFPLTGLAEASSRVTLLVFALVNAALAMIKWRDDPKPQGGMTIPHWVPWLGCAMCLALLGGTLVTP